MKDYSNLKRNYLTAISFVKRENKRGYWLFKCDCGNEKVIDVEYAQHKKHNLLRASQNRNK